MTKKQIAKEVGVGILTIALALQFAAAGIGKFPEQSGWTLRFHDLGFPDWFRILIGVLETLAAALLLVPRTAAYGAMLVIPIMIGAVATIAMHGWFRGLAQPIIALILAIIVLIARWRRRILPLMLPFRT
jgi:putative oxidoreductase